MSGHSKWKQIKHKKATTDEKRAKLFSKLANVITIAARDGADPQFNPTLRSAIETARKNQGPQANVERAIKRATEHGKREMLYLEAYCPKVAGIIVEAITDNRNRTMNEIKSLFKDYDTKLATPGSLLWSFEKGTDGYKAKFAVAASEATHERIHNLVEKLEERDDVKEVYSAIDGPV